ncbi:MAG TPA: NosD domain-containing protein [Methanothrix sp.]|nr:NosD domain-containing protein [Methanothrix sp.]HPJ84428.1 NosD domain-containing protein [Methanothrix sp.]HPR67086.1 NosD domain-containing protein [Methanothrix sp.]
MLRLTVAILIALSSGLIVGADAKMYIVDDDGFAQYHSIGEAVAIANDGDTIYVMPGSYKEHIVLNKSLTLMPPRGEEGDVNLTGDGTDIGIEVSADGCKIEGLTISDFAGPGIYVESKDNEIRKNVLVDNVHGIFLNGTSGNLLEKNQQRGGYCGIVLLASRENAIRENAAEGCILAGTLLNSSSKNSIEESKADGCGRGAHLVTNSQENRVERNSMIDCDYGVLLEKSSSANMIRDCIFEEATTAIALDAVSKNQVRNNSITNSTNGIALFSSTENGIAENSLVGLDVGIMISEASSGNVLTDNEIDESSSGIVITDSSANKLEGNVLTGIRLGLSVDGSTVESFDNQVPESNQIDGKPVLYLYRRSNEEVSGREFGHITLAACEDCTVKGCSVANDALFVYMSQRCRIQDNVVSDAFGMLVRGSDENEITGNQACDNRYGGIMLVESSGNVIGGNTLCRNVRDGLLLRESNSNEVQSNTVEANGDTGIRLLSSSETRITGNSVIGNAVGISLNESMGCIVYRNNLIDNVVQAEDDGENLWDWGVLKGGNYWSDHSCEGNPCQGQPRWIGETIADYYPFGERDGWA